MRKVVIVTHRSQVENLLEAVQSDGICQILNTEEAVVARDIGEAAPAGEKPKDLEHLLNRLESGIAFLKNYTGQAKGLESILNPRTVVDQNSYDNTVSDRQVPELLERTECTQQKIESLLSRTEQLNQTIRMLAPWKSMETPLQQLGELRTSSSMAGLIPAQYLEQTIQQLTEIGAEIQQFGTEGSGIACIAVCLKEKVSEVQKLLRSVEFEPVSFENFKGTAHELIKEHREQLSRVQKQLRQQYETAASLAKDILKLQILYDHYSNLFTRELTQSTTPATRYTVLLEGWVKRNNLPQLETIVSSFEASSVSEVEPAEDEEVPVDIENNEALKPFEIITRLYGMPKYFNVDPTAFLAPFFAIFFGLCLTDAGYGIVIIILMLLFVRKIRGDKRLMWLLWICGFATVGAGALTGGWFGDAVQQFIPALQPVRNKLMWFDPLENPMMFFGLSIVLGYIQVLFGKVIAFVHYLKATDYIAAFCDHFTWLVMLNAVVALALSKKAILPPSLSGLFMWLALIPAGLIVAMSHREGGIGARIGMGVYNLFSAVFYVGDVLSYLRLMALGMVTAGLAMAINVIAKLVSDAPYGIGIAAALLILVAGHFFNILINALGAFVHTLRLQYAEFFPKFFLGGGREFQPLSKKYKHIYIKKARV